MSNLSNNKADTTISTKLCFYSEKPQANIWGSNSICYEIYYETKNGIMQIYTIGSFGDATLTKRFGNFPLDKALELIEEMSNMTLGEFREKVVGKE